MANRCSALPDKFQPLMNIASNLWFSWNEEAVQLFRQINPQRWEDVYHNPVRLLLETTEEEWNRLGGDLSFLEQYDKVKASWERYRSGQTWFGEQYPEQDGRGGIAYFSAEFGFHESLPIYSGGLGVLAGDHLKSASDLGLPLVGIGLLYKIGYFRQKIDSAGAQIVERIEHDFSQYPVEPVQLGGEDVIVQMGIGESLVNLKIWEARIGRNPLYLLDSDLESNAPQDRELTAQLYGGNQDTRIAQEMILGIGGVKALRALGLQPSVFHINEGHAAFLSIERMREYVHAGIPFETALELIRSSTVFTTHTPVPAGHDAFPMGMAAYYLNPLLDQLVYERDRILKLAFDPEKNLFNMTFLAMNSASLRNGVSKLHGHVSRMMFRGFHGNIATEDVPIGHVTNGVHLRTWLAPEMRDLFGRWFEENWEARQSEASTWEPLANLPNESLWTLHQQLKSKLIAFARRNIREQRLRNGESAERVAEADSLLQPHALTIGFARRFATYKRAGLLFTDLDRLNRIVNHPDRPVQFIFAGKAHPADGPGQDMIRDIYRVSQMDAFRGKILILENYDVNMARHLVQGVDIWLNNPLRPLEASGTSGQKAAMNGAVNFSILDGWWEEGYDGTNGWSIDSNPNADWQHQESDNAYSLYAKLEQEIVPLYYGTSGGVPDPWVERMKRSISTLTPVYNTHRMVQDYSRHFYVPAMRRFRQFTANHNEMAVQVANFKKLAYESWPSVKAVSVFDDPSVPAPPGSKEVKVDLALGGLRPDGVAAEIVYYQEVGPIWEPVAVRLQPESDLGGGTVRFRAQIPSHLNHLAHYSVRLRPQHPLFAHRFEVPLTYSTVS